MKTQTKKRLLDAFTACQAIETFVADHTFADYEQDLHGYDSVDDELLWQTIQNNILPLSIHLEQILRSV